MDRMDSIDYYTFNELDIIDLMLSQDEIWEYLLSTPQFEEYLQELAESIQGDLKEAKKYFDDNSWSEMREFILENRDIQEALSKNLYIDFNTLKFKLKGV